LEQDKSEIESLNVGILYQHVLFATGSHWLE
jgi:hypothetical protein